MGDEKKSVLHTLHEGAGETTEEVSLEEALRRVNANHKEVARAYARCYDHGCRSPDCLAGQMLATAAITKVAVLLHSLAVKRRESPPDPAHTHKADPDSLDKVALELAFVSKRLAQDVHVQSQLYTFNHKPASA